MHVSNIRKRKMEIIFENLQKKVALNPPQILKLAKTILRHEGVDCASLSIVFVSRQRIKALNKKFLGRDYTTDVLAFDLSDEALSKSKTRRKPRAILGDIVISTDAVLGNARAYKTGLSEELALYVIHGILHLLGFDDCKTQDAQKMRRKEHQLLVFLGAKTKKLVNT